MCKRKKMKIVIKTVNDRVYYEHVKKLQRNALPLLSLKRFPAEVRIVQVGIRAPEFINTLINYLGVGLPEDILSEGVREDWTSRLANNVLNRRVLRDAVSAIKLAGGNGRVFSRRNL